MAGSIVVTTLEVGNNIVRYRIAWTSDASGSVDNNTFTMQSGSIIRVDFIPGTGGTQPTDLYDTDVEDENGVSVFDNGAGTSIGLNLSNLVALTALPQIGLPGADTFRRWNPAGLFRPQVSNAGNAKTGTIDVYVYNGVM